MPLSPSSQQKKEKRRRRELIRRRDKRMQKIRKEEEMGTYFEVPTFATTLKLLLFLCSCCHDIEAPLVGALLKLRALDTHVDIALLKL
jgi:hypothetical protein